ncbi:MAG TPA: ATP-dependent DNA helicase [Symbiobacteriaceae bacterium]|nr:ATP-dependent DNA helicase [Symbiobacteriaceae bacterium]
MTGSDGYRPNAAQEAAIAHGTGPLRIMAGAGSGKTTALVRRICRLLDDGLCRPAELLVLTFTNKAVRDIRSKIASALPASGEQPRIETYHAFALSLVKEFAEVLGYASDPALLTEGPVRLFVRRHFDRLGITAHDLRDLDRITKKAIAFFKAHRDEGTFLQPEAELLSRLDPTPESLPLIRQLLTAHRTYRELLRELGAIDYADQIALVVELLEQNAEVRSEVQSRWRYMLVDEYQDTDPLQGRMVQLLAGGHRNITVVGDPDQTIYSFRGAAISNILQFDDAFPGLVPIDMVTNYRSTPAIVGAANAVIRHNTRRKEAELKPFREQGNLPRPLLVTAGDWATEARWIARELKRLHAEEQVPWEAMAVLVRLNRHKLALYGALLEAGVPAVVVGGTDLFADAETARFIAYLRVMAAPDSDSDLAVALGLPRYGLTDADVARLGLERQRGEKLIDVVARRSPSDASLKMFLGEFWPLYQLQHTEGVAAAIAGALALHGSAMGLQARLNADQLLPLAEGFFAHVGLLADGDSLGHFCDYLDALRDVDDSPEGVQIGEEAAAVQIMTVHQAKGLEFPVVFLPRLTHRDFPLSRSGGEKPVYPPEWRHDPGAGDALEEERRIFYVGLTRAEDRLYLSWAPVDPARKKPLGPSCFLEELGETVDRCTVEPLSDAAVPFDCRDVLMPLVSRRPAARVVAVGEPAPFRPSVPGVLSFSHLSTYQACPFKFYLQYLIGLPGRPAPAADAGVRIHAAIERLARAGGTVGFEEFSRWAAVPVLADVDEDFAVDDGSGDVPLGTALGHYWASEFARSAPLAVEQEFYVRLGGGVVRGFIDRVHRRADGTVEVVDFKTYGHLLTEAQVRRSLQLPIYIKACREALGLPVNTGAFYFMKHDVVVRVVFGEEELRERWREAERLIAGARGGEWGPTPGAGCGYCGYNEVCPVAKGR